jgi:signal transduction histidine kinase
MARISAPEDVGALWLEVLQRAVGRASHDVKDALNGVSVNLEVIRSRSARPDTPASAVEKFGEAAGQQLERLSTLIEAVLALARVERQPADVAITLGRVAVLCSASASSADAAVRVIDEGFSSSAVTRIPGDALRLALMAPLLEIVAGSDRAQRMSEVVCSLRSDDDRVLVGIAAAGRRATMPERVAEAVRGAGVRWTDGERELVLAFPRVSSEIMSPILHEA